MTTLILLSASTRTQFIAAYLLRPFYSFLNHNRNFSIIHKFKFLQTIQIFRNTQYSLKHIQLVQILHMLFTSHIHQCTFNNFCTTVFQFFKILIQLFSFVTIFRNSFVPALYDPHTSFISRNSIYITN